MKRLLCLLFAAFLLCVSASALELPSELDGIVPRELIDSAEAGDDLLLRGGQYLFSHFRAALQDAVANSLRGAMALMLLSLLCGLVESTAESAGETPTRYAGYLGVLGAAVIGSGVALFLCAYKKKGQKASPGRRKAATGVLLICIAMAVGSGFMLAREIGQYKESADTYAGLSEYVTPAETDGENGNAEAPEETGASSVSLPTVDFESLLAQGPDVKAWLELPGTVIQYPVAQGEDNSYYLKHLYDGTANKVGCLFIDYENAEDFSDNNTIIYGHNMRDGSMFSTLVEYKAQAYYDEHPEMYLVTPEGGYVVEVFSAFVASPEESGSETSPWALEWKDSGAYTTWLSAMQERSVIETGVSVTSSDKVLTLSTCTNGGADRFIVMGRLVDVTE